MIEAIEAALDLYQVLCPGCHWLHLIHLAVDAFVIAIYLQGRVAGYFRI